MLGEVGGVLLPHAVRQVRGAQPLLRQRISHWPHWLRTASSWSRTSCISRSCATTAALATSSPPRAWAISTSTAWRLRLAARIRCALRPPRPRRASWRVRAPFRPARRRSPRRAPPSPRVARRSGASAALAALVTLAALGDAHLDPGDLGIERIHLRGCGARVFLVPSAARLPTPRAPAVTVASSASMRCSSPLLSVSSAVAFVDSKRTTSSRSNQRGRSPSSRSRSFSAATRSSVSACMSRSSALSAVFLQSPFQPPGAAAPARARLRRSLGAAISSLELSHQTAP